MVNVLQATLTLQQSVEDKVKATTEPLFFYHPSLLPFIPLRPPPPPLQEETFKRYKEDEEKRTEMTSHFQMMLTEIQAQIEQHSTRNDKLCHENSNLTDKLESLMNQCEMREEVRGRGKGQRSTYSFFIVHNTPLIRATLEEEERFINNNYHTF